MNVQNAINGNGYDQSNFNAQTTGLGVQSNKESNFATNNLHTKSMPNYDENKNTYNGMEKPKSSYRIKQGNPKSIVRMVEEEMAKLLEIEENKNKEYHFKK